MNNFASNFYIKHWCCLDNVENADLQFIPLLLRRKLSNINKMAIFALNKCYDDEIEEVISSSQYGEFERLVKLINQYKADKEVSPIIFSSSVHNYLVGLFMRLVNKTIPYNAVSACDNSLSTGLLSAVLSRFNNVLYCYYDELKNSKCVCLNITKNYAVNRPKVILTKTDKPFLADDFDKFIYFLKEETSKIVLGNYVLEYEKIN
ncbi:MAG: beta-ketoacyl synthase chain length factor [Candidatus Gastranaerophilales bacterium]|nr:beta-ketoacyl synthase chain length factor [Candidatus Gastranaerophilales bacterium]